MNFYKLIEGDCLDIIPTFDNESIDLIITDPPYSKTVAPSDSLADYKILEAFFREVFFKLEKVLKKDGYLFVFTDFRRYSPTFYGLYNYFKPVNLIIWKKGYLGPGIYFRPLHEQIICCIKKKPENVKSPKNRSITDIWEAKRVKNGLHPFQKPEKLIQIMIENCSEENNMILDPFIGSGTTMKVTQDLKRSCIGLEINPEYCEIIKQRCFTRKFLDREVKYEFEIWKE